ncbi:hypothetical protein FACS189475_05110 [Betaproteobacteria bacterium]|nr:hypothetical protein FACS189475_05110 [Betaproteobacteria bacterium]
MFPTFPKPLRMRLPNLLAGFVLAASAFLANAQTLEDIQSLIKQGNLAKALEQVNSFIASQPRDAQGPFTKGVILTEMGQPKEAIAVFTSLTENFPELPEPYNNLAVLYAQQKQYDKARTALEMAIRTHPSYTVAYENLGDVYAKLASQAYDKALQLDSANAAAQNKLALIHDLVSAPTRPGARAKTPRVVAAVPAPQTPLASNTPTPAAQPAPEAAAPAVTPLARTETTSATTPTPPAVVSTPAPTPEAAATTVSPAPTPPEATPDAPAATASASTPPATVVKPVPDSAASTPPAVSPAAVQEAANAVKAAAPQSNAIQEIRKTIAAWAAAWSKQDVTSYLAFYAPAFKTPKGVSRENWEAERKERLTRQQWIKVSYENLQITLDGNRATARFRQHYKASGFNGSSDKTLVLTRSDNAWQILDETAR